MSKKHKLRSKDVAPAEVSTSDVKKELFLEISIGLFLFALSQLGEVIKALKAKDSISQFYMILFIISLTLSGILFGIWIGIYIVERKRKRPQG